MTGYFRQNAPQPPREPGADSHGPRQRGRGGRSGHAASSDPRDLPPTLQTGAEDHSNDDAPVNEPHRGNDSHHALREPVNAPPQRPMGSYFQQQPPAAEPPAELAEPTPPADPQPAAARGRGRSRKPAPPPPVEVVTPPAVPEGQTVPQASSGAASALPVAPAETEPDQPKKAPARPRRTRKPPEGSAPH